MCGIAGFDIDGRDARETSAVLSRALSFRGPRRELVRGPGSYCSRQHAAWPSSTCRRPSSTRWRNEQNDVHLAFNGEIYDHSVLRRDLESHGQPLVPTPTSAIQQFEMRTYLPGDLLCKEDRATMAVGLEGRVPLLDDAPVRLAERTPERRMMSLRRGKIILRDLAERYGAAVSSLKRGFAVPLGEYFVGPWRCDAREWFHSAETDFVDRRSAMRLLDERIHPASDLWMLATLIAWENLLKSVRTAAGRDATNLQAAPA